MKKVLILGLLAVLVVSVVVAGHEFNVRVTEVSPPPADKLVTTPPAPPQQIAGKYGETIVEHSKGTDILPPKASSPKFAGYKAYRLGVLESLSRSIPEKKVEATVTFAKPLTPNEFDSFATSYSVVAVEGFEKNKTNFWEIYVRYLLYKEEVESITSAVIEGTGQELLKIQENNKVLLVDANIEGIHPKVMP